MVKHFTYSLRSVVFSELVAVTLLQKSRNSDGVIVNWRVKCWCDINIYWFRQYVVMSRKYTLIHNYGNPWFLLYSFWINRHNVIKFSTCPVVNAVMFAKTHCWLNVCSKCPPLALMHARIRVHHCLIAASINNALTSCDVKLLVSK